MKKWNVSSLIGLVALASINLATANPKKSPKPVTRVLAPVVVEPTPVPHKVFNPKDPVARQDREIETWLKAQPAPKSVVNRGKNPSLLLLEDGGSSVLLPPMWKSVSRGAMQTDEMGLRTGVFSHYFTPLKGTGGIIISILLDEKDGIPKDLYNANSLRKYNRDIAAGRYDKLFDETNKEFNTPGDPQRRANAANAQIDEVRIKGLTGFIRSDRRGWMPRPTKNDQLGVTLKYRYAITVISDTKSYSVFNGTAFKAPGTETILNSFQPR